MMKILVIGDSTSIREDLITSMQSDGYKVLTAEESREGFEIFSRENPPMVFLDVSVPDMDGIEVLKRVKERNPEVQVVIISDSEDVDLLIQILQCEATDFICKPVGEGALERLGGHLEGDAFTGTRSVFCHGRRRPVGVQDGVMRRPQVALLAVGDGSRARPPAPGRGCRAGAS